MPTAALFLHSLDQALDHGLGVAVEHRSVRSGEEGVLDARESSALSPLQDEYGLRSAGVDDGHTGDRRAWLERHWVHDVIGADHHGDVSFRYEASGIIQIVEKCTIFTSG